MLKNFVTALLAVTCMVAGSAIAQPDPALSRIATLRLAGQLGTALALGEQSLAATTDADIKVLLHLELARIHDRTGLHRNTRPVAAALENIEAAARAAAPGHKPSQARLALARADYFYRAEMPDRQFPVAAGHAASAIRLFTELGDHHGRAEAVHRLGLIEMQRGNLGHARELFDESLALDRLGGERVFFRGEYERHVGFVVLLEGKREDAIPYFERSLAARREAGAIDASLFAAETLAAALVEAGRLDEARPAILYAMLVGEKIDSPVGLARSGLTLGRLYARENDPLAARLAFEMTRQLATELGAESLLRTANSELEHLESGAARR